MPRKHDDGSSSAIAVLDLVEAAFTIGVLLILPHVYLRDWKLPLLGGPILMHLLQVAISSSGSHPLATIWTGLCTIVDLAAILYQYGMASWSWPTNGFDVDQSGDTPGLYVKFGILSFFVLLDVFHFATFSRSDPVYDVLLQRLEQMEQRSSSQRSTTRRMRSRTPEPIQTFYMPSVPPPAAYLPPPVSRSMVTLTTPQTVTLQGY